MSKKRPKSSKARPPKHKTERLDLAEELQTLLAQETKLAQEVSLHDSPNLTYRDEANVIVYQVLRAGFLEELHAGRWSPILADPSCSRITQDEMKRLMIETAAKLAHWLYARDLDLKDDPRHYLDKIEMLRNIFAQDWDRHALSSDVPDRDPGQTPGCRSCQAPIHDQWRFCPMCGAEAAGPNSEPAGRD